VLEASVEVQTGAVVSATVTVADVVAVLLQESVAVQVRVTLYLLAQLPPTVLSEEVTTGLVASHASLALGVPNVGVEGH
jgi:hypothetical protein